MASIWKINTIRDPRHAIRLVGVAFSTIRKEIQLRPVYNYLNKEDPAVLGQLMKAKL